MPALVLSVIRVRSALSCAGFLAAVDRDDPGADGLVSRVAAPESGHDEPGRCDDGDLSAATHEPGGGTHLRTHAALRELPVCEVPLGVRDVRPGHATLGVLSEVELNRVDASDQNERLRMQLVGELS